MKDYNTDGFYSQALYYDVLFGWDRSEELLFVDSTFQRHQLEVGQSILEVACGTGVAAIQLSALGWKMSGLDISENMIQRMKERCKKSGRPIAAHCADMRDFQLPRACDGAYCPLGSIGLLPTDADMLAHFKSMAKNMTTEGVYIIDLGLNPEGTALCNIHDIEWAMDIDGIAVEAINGMVQVNDSVNDIITCFEWEGIPLEYEWQHFKSLVDQSGVFQVEAFYPEAGQSEEGISLFHADKEGFEDDCERAMVVLRKI